MPPAEFIARARFSSLRSETHMGTIISFIPLLREKEMNLIAVVPARSGGMEIIMNNALNEARDEIRRVDKEMAKLFEERMQAAKKVAEYKKEHGLPVLDAKQEAAVIERNSALIKNGDILPYYKDFIKNMMDISKQYQHALLDGVKIAINGEEGAFAHVAAKRIFPDAEAIFYKSFADAYEAVQKGECESAVIPIENSFAGEVGQVMDIMFQGDLYITGVYTLPISQNLLGVQGARVADIKEVISHPQALMQCGEYIKERGFEKTPFASTSAAAHEVAKRGDKKIAAIANRETADIYGLTVLDHDINESAQNTTKFAVFSRKENKERGKMFILMFTVNDAAGTLAKAISVISSHGFNMKALRSRPVKDAAWQYYFYVEAEGDDSSDKGREMLRELANVCEKLKVVGRYGAEIDLENV